MSALPRRNPAAIVILAALALVIAVGLLSAIAVLFLGDGLPFEQAVLAERACSESAYISERDACMRAFVAAAQRPAVASRRSRLAVN
jgi:hypothetical protein